MDGLPVNRFSGTVLEQANASIFEAFWRSPERVPLPPYCKSSSRSRSDRLRYGCSRDTKRLNDEARRLGDATCSLSRSFRGVPLLLLLELRFVRRRRRPRRTLPPVLRSL